MKALAYNRVRRSQVGRGRRVVLSAGVSALALGVLAPPVAA